MNDRVKPRLYLITPPIQDAEAFVPALTAALSAGDIACVMLRFANMDDKTKKNACKRLALIAQQAEAAVLALNEPQLTTRAELDGVHMLVSDDEQEIEALEDALESLHPDYIVGASGMPDRDAAMRLGELEVDYLMFGALDGVGDSSETILEQASWWAQIFNVPCVAIALKLEDMPGLARSGCEFIALGDAAFGDPQRAAEIVAQAQAIIDAAEAEALL